MRYAVLFTFTKQYKIRYTHTYIYVTATATIHTHTDINNKIIRIIIKKKPIQINSLKFNQAHRLLLISKKSKSSIEYTCIFIYTVIDTTNIAYNLAGISDSPTTTQKEQHLYHVSHFTYNHNNLLDVYRILV